jgi:acetyl-CoA acyltransferase
MWQYTPRVAVVRGLRTPFAKSGTHYARLSALDLGKLVVAELVQRSGIDPNSIQELVFGNVIPSVKAPNIAREIILGTGLPRKLPGYTVSKACASSNQAITSAADLIFRGYADVVVAGGSESLSRKTFPTRSSERANKRASAANSDRSPRSVRRISRPTRRRSLSRRPD